MPQQHKARRQEIKARLDHAQRILSATRNSVCGHSRAVLLHLEREIQASKKELASLDAQPAGFGRADDPAGMKP